MGEPRLRPSPMAEALVPGIPIPVLTHTGSPGAADGEEDDSSNLS
ncbi:rCG56553 [Rattus norvegicus]|uniref:RCG56553 n=1 Tax=Rattus norvegicus TaxID=10116 RepID=A6IA94_RAT|nr:rCG56553 [Rattus norvegicus]